MRRVLKAAACLVLAASVFGLAGLLRLGPPLAFAEVARPLHDAHTLTFQITIQAPEQHETMTLRVLVKDPQWVRMENPGGQVSVGRQDLHKFLTLNPADKTAVLVEMKPHGPPEPGQADPAQLAERLRKLVEKEGQPIGQKQVGDVQAQGFRVEQDGQEWLVWADPHTRLPLRVDVTLPQNVQATLSDFRFNPPLEDTLFRLEPPEGYKLQTLALDIPQPEEALVWLLRTYAQTAGGKFPPRLDDPAALGKYFHDARGGKAPNKPNREETLRFVMNLTRVEMLLQTHKRDFGYRPVGARQGDAAKLVFWYRPAGSLKYRALYGDLHWADVTADELPSRPRP